MTWDRIIFFCGSMSGPVVAITILRIHGNQWDVSALTLPLSIGLVCIAISAIISFFVQEQWTLSVESDNVQEELRKRGKKAKKCFCFNSDTHIPYLVVFRDILGGLASGMTIKFFPLFFEQIVKLDPVSLQVNYLCSTIALAIITYAVKLLADKIGRVPSILISTYLGISLGWTLAFGKYYFWDVSWAVCLIWVLRTAFMNCTVPLSKSILNDYTNKESRNTWNSFESISSFGWSGSAVLGGWMLDKLGYEWVFIITFGLQLVMTIPVWILLFLVPGKETAVAVDIPSAGEQIETFFDNSGTTLDNSDDSFSSRDFTRKR
eukprot:TRINITY_DN759_c0_g1_i1.p1 TRINITY_DN759_c0_g1~~TRINITY_DN759_c0_g1_i1.p1  ORF type:complete len:320 (-),score=34.99 TRINITY_DN759_c0_g1_i1:244-1203(-)